MLISFSELLYRMLKETRLYFLYMGNLKNTMHFLDTWTVNIQIRA